MTIPAVGELPEIPPGSFGSITADSHNAYECYVSPYITRRFVETTIENDGQFMPLPVGHFPQDTIPNMNLLGYSRYENIPYEALSKLRNYRFPNKDNMTGRLQLVPNLMYDVLHELSNSESISMVHYHKIQRKSVHTGLVYARVMTARDGKQNQSYLSSQPFTLYSPYSFEETTIAQAILFALRRQRTQRARGLCYTYVDGLPPNGWELTINHNFMMAGAYAPEIGMIHPHLRVPLQQVDVNVGDRTFIIEDWCHRFLIN
ncbi:uncharacterized protein LOC116852874 isoform X2 [Odontomachus brunneus]|nr:uncharacterized protein LOC116852874 isoform X2 [Odontomachus brunneus]XP_032689516.1 uncharacterized protein LOC116852874 isoform X2 [Odontomachus brunneus]